MEITNVRYELNMGYPLLKLDLDGHPAVINTEQKLLRFGYVFLGAEIEFRQVLPPVIVPADPEDGRPQPQEFHGFIGDEQILRLYAAFTAAEAVLRREAADSDTFPEGPIAD